jgi:hypothetical protein
MCKELEHTGLKTGKSLCTCFSMNKFYTILPHARQAVLTGGSDVEKAGTNYRDKTILRVFLFFIICRFYKFTFSEQT